MSDKNPIVPETSAKNRNPLVLLRNSVVFKDTMIFLGWIASILIIAGVFWFFTQPLRNRLMLRAVNRVLIQLGDSRRLAEESSPETGSSLLTGSWFVMTGASAGGSKVVVFSFIGEGTFFPCAAVVSQDGKVREFIPLNSHGEKMLKRISPGILRIYTRRIEGAQV